MKKEIDIRKHVLVPRHAKLGERDKEALFSKYEISGPELPKILKEDAALEGFDVKPGDVIKIMRKSRTAGESVFYRVVVNA